MPSLIIAIWQRQRWAQFKGEGGGCKGCMCTAIVFYFVDLLYLIILNRGRRRGRQKTQRYVQHPPVLFAYSPRCIPLCTSASAFASASYRCVCFWCIVPTTIQFNWIKFNAITRVLVRVRVRVVVIVIVGTAASLHVQLQSSGLCRSMHKSWLCWALPLPICVICLPILKYSFTLIVNGLAGLETSPPSTDPDHGSSSCHGASLGPLAGQQQSLAWLAHRSPQPRRKLFKNTHSHTHTHMYIHYTHSKQHTHTHNNLISAELSAEHHENCNERHKKNLLHTLWGQLEFGEVSNTILYKV